MDKDTEFVFDYKQMILNLYFKFKSYFMRSQLLTQLDLVSGYKNQRVLVAQFVLNHPPLFEELIHICFDHDTEKSYKACWVLEQVVFHKIEWLQPHLDFLCQHLKQLQHDSAIRPMAKVVQLVVENHFQKNTLQLSTHQLEQITECCFDWLISNTKVASKCYSMRTLFVLGKSNDWIYPELQIIIEKEYSTQSAAFKAVSKELLKKIK